MNSYSWEVSREVAITEVWLDKQARYAQPWPVPARVWASELAKALVWIVGVVLFVVLMALLAPDARADSIPTQPSVASYIDLYTPLPLAVGVDKALALNLLAAQRDAWGNNPASWQVGSLLASENSVLKAISLYIFDGGPSLVTSDKVYFWAIWDQSRVAVDVTTSGTFTPSAAYFGEVAVATPEPRAWLLMGFALVAFAVVRYSRRSLAYHIVRRFRAYRPRPLRDMVRP